MAAAQLLEKTADRVTGPVPAAIAEIIETVRGGELLESSAAVKSQASADASAH